MERERVRERGKSTNATITSLDAIRNQLIELSVKLNEMRCS